MVLISRFLNVVLSLFGNVDFIQGMREREKVSERERDKVTKATKKKARKQTNRKTA